MTVRGTVRTATGSVATERIPFFIGVIGELSSRVAPQCGESLSLFLVLGLAERVLAAKQIVREVGFVAPPPLFVLRR